MRNGLSADQPFSEPWITPRFSDSATWVMLMPTGTAPINLITAASAGPGARIFKPLMSLALTITRLKCMALLPLEKTLTT